jgi:hypothetical protein
LNEYATTTKFPLQISNQSKIETIINLFSKTHYTSKKQAATTRPKFKQPPRDQNSSSHNATKNQAATKQQATTQPRINQPPHDQESSIHQVNKNQPANTPPRPRIKQPPQHQESSNHHTNKNQAPHN